MVSFYNVVFILIILTCVLLSFDIYLLLELHNLRDEVETNSEAIETNARIIYDSNLGR